MIVNSVKKKTHVVLWVWLGVYWLKPVGKLSSLPAAKRQRNRGILIQQFGCLHSVQGGRGAAACQCRRQRGGSWVRGGWWEVLLHRRVYNSGVMVWQPLFALSVEPKEEECLCREPGWMCVSVYKMNLPGQLCLLKMQGSENSIYFALVCCI